MEGYADIVKTAGVEARLTGEPPMLDIVFTDHDVSDYPSALGDQAKMKQCKGLLRKRGVLKSEGKYYVSLAHTKEDVEFTLDAFASSIAALH